MLVSTVGIAWVKFVLQEKKKKKKKESTEVNSTEPSAADTEADASDSKQEEGEKKKKKKKKGKLRNIFDTPCPSNQPLPPSQIAEDKEWSEYIF